MDQDEEMGCILLYKFAKIFDRFSFKSIFDLSKTMLMSSSLLFSLVFFLLLFLANSETMSPTFFHHFGLNEKEVPHISNCASILIRYMAKIMQNVHRI